jgi:Sigma-70, region 4
LAAARPLVTALQLLPPRQRAVLILRDVLGFRASEAAGILDCTEESVTSALKRARAAEAGNVDELVTLLTEDAWLVMPPVPVRYQGRELAARFWSATAFRPGRSARLVPTRANGQPAFGLYIRDPQAPVAHANGILVLTLAGRQISAVTGFPDKSALRIFGLPGTLPD